MTTNIEKEQTSLNPTEETKPAKQIQITAEEQAKLDEKLLFAAITGKTKRLNGLIKQGANPNAVTEYGASAVSLAIKNQQIWTAEILKNNGAKINGEDKIFLSIGLGNAKREVKRAQNELEIKRKELLEKHKIKAAWEKFIARER